MIDSYCGAGATVAGAGTGWLGLVLLAGLNMVLAVCIVLLLYFIDEFYHKKLLYIKF